MKSTDYCTITNRSPGVAAYYLPETNTLREFFPREQKKVLYSEVEAVCAQPGGRELLYNYFYIDGDGVAEELLNVKPEPEYFLTEDKIDSWMSSCSLDAFKDALDFAPSGVKELIKRHAVTLPLNDLSKCEAIKAQLGFDVMRAIQNERDTLAKDEDEVEVPTASKRRVAPAEAGPQRRITPKYDVVKREEK